MRQIILVIGAPKSATSSLANWLSRHPEICFNSRNKEPGYFRGNKDSFVINARKPEERERPDPNSPMVNKEAYLNLYADAKPTQWALDGSTDYLSDDGAAERIKEFSKEYGVKLICMLRDPVDRTYSEYLHTMREWLEPLSFRESIAAESERVRANYQPLFFHIRRSRYYDDIKKYQSMFGSDLLLLDYGIVKNEAECRKQVLGFLGIQQDAEFGPMLHINASATSKNTPTADRARDYIARMLTNLGSKNPRLLRRAILSSKMSESDRDYVFSLLKDDIEKCVADPTIPTDGWRSAKRISPQARSAPSAPAHFQPSGT